MSTPMTAPAARIATLDVVRGVALLGIFLMNVEFFSRPLAELGDGLPAGAAGVDAWAGWAVHVFVRGKFWTMFSLLFGMGFAVMGLRAEQAGRAFVGPYLRRTLALGAIGALHFIFLWGGDILFNYSLGALLLLLVTRVRPRRLLVAAAIAAGVAAIVAVAPAPAWLRWQLLADVALGALALAAVAAGVAAWKLEGLRRLGLTLYLAPFLAMAAGGAVMTLHPPQAAEQAAAHDTSMRPSASADGDERAERLRRRAAEARDEARVLQHGRYPEVVALRASRFGHEVASAAGFSVVLLGMFLLGAWFVRSGVMLRPEEHLSLFRALAWAALPVGIALSLASAAIATRLVPGHNDGAYQLAVAIAMLGSLPTCLGYVGVIVLGYHGSLRRIFGVFGPAGRMALTNYLLQSLVGTWVFYGYGLGHWGMGRALQLVFVAVVFALQLGLSHWWLARFRYGPMEWLWRSVTYLQVPRMRQVRTAS